MQRSSVLDKKPNINSLTPGELTINFNSGVGKSFLCTKKNNSTIAVFHEDAHWDNIISGINQTILDITLGDNQKTAINLIANNMDTISSLINNANNFVTETRLTEAINEGITEVINADY